MSITDPPDKSQGGGGADKKIASPLGREGGGG